MPLVTDMILPGTAALVLALASFFDLKTREVPDWLSFGLIGTAVGIRAIAAVQLGWSVLLSGLFGLAAGVVLGYILYFTRQWGGGDSKLLMGMGAVIGIAYPWSSASLQLLWFFLLLLFLGAFYGLLWMAGLAIRHAPLFVPQWKEQVAGSKTVQMSVGATALLLLLPAWYIRPLWPLALFPPAFLYAFFFLRAVEKSCFLKQVSPERLTEGDWLAESVSTSKNRHYEPKTLTLEDIGMLQRLQREGRVSTVLIRLGVPFVPSFLLTYLLLWLGNPWLLKMLAFLL